MIDDDPRIDPADIRAVRFPGSRRRYEAPAVDQFVASLVDRVTRTNALIDDLRRQIEVAEAAAGDARSSSPFDEPDLSALSDEELVNLVGAETAHVLSTARRAADDIKAKAEESAARLIREATTEAQQTTAVAEERAAALIAEASEARDVAVVEADAAAAEVRARAAEEVETLLTDAGQRADEVRAEAEAVKTDADADAERIRSEARDEGRAMVNEAKAVRGRVLDDLQRRRDLARTQIQTLLTGRERLLAAYERVRTDLDLATAELDAAGPALADAEADADAAHDELIRSLGADDDPTGGDPSDDATDDESDAPEADASDVDDEVAVDTGIEGSHGPEVSDADDTEVADAAAEVAAEEADIEPSDAEPDVVDDPESEQDPDTDLDSVSDADPEPEPAVADEASAETADVADVPADPPDIETDDEPESLDEADAPTPDDEPTEPGEPDEPDVDALFARIRAERAESVARAQRVLSGAADPSPAAPAAVEPADAAVPATDVEAVPPASAAADAVADAARDAMSDDDDGAGDAAPSADDVDAVPAELLAPAAEHERRQAALDQLDAQLSRALKRHLADEQNEVLDGLRRSQSTAVDELLPEAGAHVAGYAGVALPLLESAALAGADTDASVDVSALADRLAAGLVDPFRRRIERAASEVDGDPDALDERLRAVYREWKVSHIGAATTDVLLTAYAQGQLASAPAGATVRWRIDPSQGPCPDAQDNALAGALAVGEAFPTGDTCPQAHTGCRCLLVVDA